MGVFFFCRFLADFKDIILSISLSDAREGVYARFAVVRVARAWLHDGDDGAHTQS
jgi:hypothetical protein